MQQILNLNLIKFSNKKMILIKLAKFNIRLVNNLTVPVEKLNQKMGILINNIEMFFKKEIVAKTTNIHVKTTTSTVAVTIKMCKFVCKVFNPA